MCSYKLNIEKCGTQNIATDKSAITREFQCNGVNASLEAEARCLGTLSGTV